MRKVEVIAPAKINLALDIVGVNDKNYHLMNMVMQTITMFDKITIRKNIKSGISLACNLYYIPCNENNIAWKTAQAFFDYVGIKYFGIDIYIEKKIPSQAGLAGGSADGAGVLLGLNKLYNTNLSMQTLCEIGAKIGADIPFCIMGKTAHVTGIGEIIKPISNLQRCCIVIAKPQIGIRTAKAFAEFDEKQIPPHFDDKKMISAIENNDLNQVGENMYNAFEQVCDVEDVFTIKNDMIKCGAINSIMTGSGSAVFGIFDDIKKAGKCSRELKKKYAFVNLCHPYNFGAKIVE